MYGIKFQHLILEGKRTCSINGMRCLRVENNQISGFQNIIVCIGFDIGSSFQNIQNFHKIMPVRRNREVVFLSVKKESFIRIV